MERQHDRQIPERRQDCGSDGRAVGRRHIQRRTGQHYGDVEGRGPNEQVAIAKHHGVATESIR